MGASRLGNFLKISFVIIILCYLIFIFGNVAVHTDWFDVIESAFCLSIAVAVIYSIYYSINHIWDNRNRLLRAEWHFTAARWVCGLAVLSWWVSMPALFYAKTMFHPHLR